MKKRWQVLILTLIFTLFIAASSLAAASTGPSPPAMTTAPAGSQAATNSAQRVDEDEFNSFIEDFFAGYSVEITPEQMEALHSLYDQIAGLEANEDYIEAYDGWNEFYALTDPLWENAVYQYPSFDEFMEGWMPPGITDADRVQLEQLYNDATALEEEEDWDGAAAKWEQFYGILEPYWAAENWIDEDWTGEDWTDEDWTDEEWSEDTWTDENYDPGDGWEEWEYPSFEEFYGEEYLDDLGLTEAERTEMKSLYDEAVALEENGDYAAAETRWNELWEIEDAHYDEYCANYEYPPFDEFIAEFPAEYSPRALEQMRQLYDEAVELEQNGDWETAAEKWNALYYIMDRFGAFNGLDCEGCGL